MFEPTAQVQDDSSAPQFPRWNEGVKNGAKLDTAGPLINKPGVYLKTLRETREHGGK